MRVQVGRLLVLWRAEHGAPLTAGMPLPVGGVAMRRRTAEAEGDRTGDATGGRATDGGNRRRGDCAATGATGSGVTPSAGATLRR